MRYFALLWDLVSLIIMCIAGLITKLWCSALLLAFQ